MSAVDLFLLGFFIRPQNEWGHDQRLPQIWSAYELAHFIRQNDLGELIKVSTPAVYKNLVSLARKGYLVAGVKNGVRLSEKRVYSVTGAGEAYFLDLSQRLAADPPFYHFAMNSFIVNLDRLPAQVAIAGLKNIRASLESKREHLAAYASRFSFIPLPGRGIIRQQINLNETMLVWLDAFTEEYGRSR